jgi:beta-lactamase superfamily II metal-dependent hydrolase
MILPHHGSTNNLETRFVQHFNPSSVIASCSKRSVQNAYHPPEGSPIQGLYTANNGAITVKINTDGGLTVESFLNTAKN